MQTSIPQKDYTSRRGELSAYGRAVNSSHFLRRLLIGFGTLTVTLILFAAVLLSTENSGVRLALLFAVSALIVGSICVWKYTREHFIDPDLAFRKWLQEVCDGELSAGIDLPPNHRHYKELDFHTRNLASALRQLSTDMETMVDTQTRRLENQNQVLELMFQLTTDVASEIDFQSVLSTVCVHLSGWLGKAQVAAYLIDEDDTSRLKLRASSSSDRFMCSGPCLASELPEHEFSSQSPIAGMTSQVCAGGTEGQRFRIPIFKGKVVVGMLEAIVSGEHTLADKESQRVFRTVSEQLSLFVDRDSALESAHNARLIRERSQLGAEIHDSLAQTLLAARYQITLLRETFDEKSSVPLHDDLLRIEGMIDEANSEVRGLISEYRKPLSEHRYAQSIQNTIDEFHQSSDVDVFFQLEDPDIRFTAREDSVIDRIVGEALINARKYSNASMIRVYVHDEASGVRSILIEDDGVGFESVDLAQLAESADGSQIGLSIMRDRALSIGAKLSIDTEPGEGTRVYLKLPPLTLAEEG